MIRVWYSLRISQSDFVLLTSALEELLAASDHDVSTLTNEFMNMVAPDQLCELKRVWKTWLQLSTRRGRWVTERRKAAFQRDRESKVGIENYLNSIPQRHRDSAILWMEDGLFTSQCETSCLTKENVTLTGSSFQFKKGDISDYDFSIDPSNLPFSGWDYKAVKKICYNDSLPEMYCTYLSNILNKCLGKLRSCQVKLYVILCDCMAIEPFLPVELKYDRVTTSNLTDYISFTPLLTKFKEQLNTNNRHSVLVTEVYNWVDSYLPEIKVQIMGRCLELAPKVVQDTKNPLLVGNNLTSFVEYHDQIPDFQLYLRAALLESRSEEELAYLVKKIKIPSIKAITASLGLELRDYVRNENTVFPFKWAVNCRTVNLMRGHEFTLEWKVPS